MMRTLLSITACLATAAGTARAGDAEICGDGRDNDGDGYADEGCAPARVSGICESPLGCQRTGAIAPVTGALVYDVEPDLDAGVAIGPALRFARVYTSHYDPGYFPNGVATYRHPLGRGWQHSFMSWLDRDPTTGAAIVHLTTGQDALFTPVVTADGWQTFRAQAGFTAWALRQRAAAPFDWELRSPHGMTYAYDFDPRASAGKLIQIRDGVPRQELATNAVTIAYDGAGQISRITEVLGVRYLQFTYQTTGPRLLASVAVYSDPAQPTGHHHRDFQYDTRGRLVAIGWRVGAGDSTTIDGRYAYDAGDHLIAVTDPTGAFTTAAFTYRAGAIARVAGPDGHAGYDDGDPSCEAGAGTTLSFNRASTNSCVSDGDCGTGNFCGGKDAGGTGACFRAKRCLGTESRTEYLWKRSSKPSCPSCAGVDLYTIDYGIAGERLDVTAIAIDGRVRSREYDGYGNVVHEVYNDDDYNPSNPNPSDSSEYWYYYDDPAVAPSRRLEKRSRSRLSTAPCDATHTAGCKRTIDSYTDNLLRSTTEQGFTYGTAGTVVPYSYMTTFEYDADGLLTFRRGPRPGVADDIEYVHVAAGAFRGSVKEVKISTGPGAALSYKNGLFTFANGPTWFTDPNGAVTCLTFVTGHPHRVESVRRIAAGTPTSCPAEVAADRTTRFEYSTTSNQLTKITFPKGNCLRNTYSSAHKLLETVAADFDPAAGTCAASGDRTTFAYDANGALVRRERIDAAGTVRARDEQEFGADHRLWKIFNPALPSAFVELLRDATGRVIERRREDFPATAGRTEFMLDALIDPAEIVEHLDSAASRSWTIERDSTRYPDRITGVNDPAGHRIGSRFDDMERAIERTNPDGGRVYAAYDEASNLIRQVNGAGGVDQKTTQLAYDAANRLSSVNTGDPNCTSASGAELAYTYDAVPAGTCPAGSTCQLLAGHLASVRTQIRCDYTRADARFDMTTFYSYDAFGEVAEHTLTDDSGRSDRTAYQWDENGSVTRIDYPFGATTGAVYTRGGATSPADDDRVVALARGVGTIIDQAEWFPFGPIKQYRQMNAFRACAMCTAYFPTARFSRNLAYRATDIDVDTTGGHQMFRLALTEDARGRVVARDFSDGTPAKPDTWFRFDTLDRVTCQSPAASASCPASGAAVHGIAYGAGDDRASFTIDNAKLAPTTFTAAYRTLPDGRLTSQLASLAKSTGGQIDFGWDSRGNRLFDDDSSVGGASDDRRTFTYDGRDNLITVAGKQLVLGFGGSSLHDYVVTNAYDDRNHRVFKSFHDVTAGTEAQWFFNYDIFGHLIEARFVPDITMPDATIAYQWYWLDAQPIAVVAVDDAGAVLSRDFFAVDEQNRPQATWSWPTTAWTSTPVRTWEAEPGLFGWDIPTVGSFQPLRFPGQYYDEETEAETTTATLRPGVTDNLFRAYDSLTGTYLQVDPQVRATLSSYGYAANDPVDRSDPTGLSPCGLNAHPLFTVTDGYGDPITDTVCACDAGYYYPYGGDVLEAGEDCVGGPTWHEPGGGGPGGGDDPGGGGGGDGGDSYDELDDDRLYEMYRICAEFPGAAGCQALADYEYGQKVICNRARFWWGVAGMSGGPLGVATAVIAATETTGNDAHSRGTCFR